MPRLEGCTALVTGGTAGIGLATATRLVEYGATVFVTGRRALDVPGLRSLTVDMTDPQACHEAVDAVIEATGGLDILVNNAGTMLVDTVEEAREVDWAQMADLNLMAAATTTRAALPHLLAASARRRGCADLVFVSSLAAADPSAGRAFYAATKAGIAAFADVLRVEQASTGVRVGTVRPGLTATGLRAANSGEAVARMAAAAPRLAEVTPLPPERVAEAIVSMVCLPSDASVSELTILPASQGR